MLCFPLLSGDAVDLGETPGNPTASTLLGALGYTQGLASLKHIKLQLQLSLVCGNCYIRVPVARVGLIGLNYFFFNLV